ncbi:MAG: 5'-nucleotidase C-terminal domain-containing protein [Rikenellaceae bacterium]|jgi:2',3'-cyclic-nucleotide 2'-phosphodiesterase (5'-nucleotidase family)|nr:5'-nucleotidase C-terminal domain-containing protein [Rikenellaceae bacterium]
MRRAIFITFLSTLCLFVRAQEAPVRASEQTPIRLIFTTHYQQHLFGYDPVWHSWSDSSLSRALTYIRSHRRAVGEDHFALINTGREPSAIYRLYPEDMRARVEAVAGYEALSRFHRAGLTFQVAEWDSGAAEPANAPADFHIGLFASAPSAEQAIAGAGRLHLAVIAQGNDPEVYRVIRSLGDTVTVLNTGLSGRYIGVADIRSATDFTVRWVDISGFPVEAEYEMRFEALTDSLRAFYDKSIATVPQTLSQEGYLLKPTPYMALFHRFQREASGADISFFAPPLAHDSIPAGALTFADVLRRFRYDNTLCVVRLTREEIRRYLEHAYGLRYNTVRRSSDNLLRLRRTADGTLQLRSAPYNLDEAGGLRYEVDVSRPAGQRIRILSMPDAQATPYYTVALNSHRIESGYLARACGLTPEQIADRLVWESQDDYRLLLIRYLTKNPFHKEWEAHWQVIPESFAERVREF